MTGIYMITNKINNKCYIGSAVNITSRWNQHIYLLECKKHHSIKLQKAWNKYNPMDFSFSVLEIVNDKNKLFAREQYWLDYTECWRDENGYNMNQFADNQFKITTKLNNKITREDINDDFLSIITQKDKDKLRNNINILEHKKLNKIGEKGYSLTKTWFINNSDKLDVMKNNILNYFINILNAKSNELYWTVFYNFKTDIQNKGFIKSYLFLDSVCSEKRNNLAFIPNIYPNEFNNIINKDRNNYSLSVLLHWIISNANIDKPINIYIPSKRMRNLLIDWLSY